MSPLARMGEGLGYRRPGSLSLFLRRLLVGLPRLDPNQYGLADYDFYAGPVNFNVAKQNGLRRPIIRVGQGAYGTDPQFKASSANSKGVFSSRDFYWMLDSHQSANGQANACAALLSAYGNPDPDSILFADFELAPVDASFLWGFLATIRSLLPVIRLGIYTGYSYWATYGSLDPKYSFEQYLLWISWPVSPYISPRPLAPWGTNWYYHQWTFNGDGSYYGASGGLDLDYRNPAISPTPDPEVYVVQRPLAETDILITPSPSDILPLKTPFAQMLEYGWDAAMNCGAGFVYTDATHAQINTVGFQFIQLGSATVYYARKMITAGVVNSQLDTSYLAPWSMLGYAGANVYLIVTRGQEGMEGMTQMQAAQWALAQGITELYLFDSGHSSAIAENGMQLYSAYGEAVPQCIGFKARATGGTIMQGIAKANTFTNIKSMTAGVANWKDQLVGGGVVYGTPAYDLTGKLTDLTSFDHYYLSDGGTRVELGGLYKVSVGNLVVSNTPEPTPPPPPPPAPPPAVTLTIPSLTVAVTLPDGTVNTFAAQNITLTKQ